MPKCTAIIRIETYDSPLQYFFRSTSRLIIVAHHILCAHIKYIKWHRF
jgi:hypothetical protein